jgi:hypothetical protein
MLSLRACDRTTSTTQPRPRQHMLPEEEIRSKIFIIVSSMLSVDIYDVCAISAAGRGSGRTRMCAKCRTYLFVCKRSYVPC